MRSRRREEAWGFACAQSEGSRIEDGTRLGCPRPRFLGRPTALVLERVAGPSPSPAWPEGPNSQSCRGQDLPWIVTNTDLVRCVQVRNRGSASTREIEAWLWERESGFEPSEVAGDIGGVGPAGVSTGDPDRAPPPALSLPPVRSGETRGNWEVDFREVAVGVVGLGMDVPPSASWLVGEEGEEGLRLQSPQKEASMPHCSSL